MLLLFDHKTTGKTSVYLDFFDSQDTCKYVTCLMLLMLFFPQHLKNRRIRVDIAGQQQQQGEESIFIKLSSVAQYNVMKPSLYLS